MFMTSCNYVCCHSCNGSQEPFFNKTMLGLTRQRCHKTISALLLPFPCLPDTQFVSNRAYLGSFGRQIGNPTSVNELDVRLQQIWNEMSQDIIQNLYAPLPDRIASCIRAKGGSTGY
ncbi:uncharacterized protein TNCV_3702881 [Trichonephila clavipes]|nr:uncharacterized protein TNCV_3702881 [Trichonephila clavipes]